MNKRTFTNEQLIESVKNSTSVRQILTQLDLKEAGGNYASIKKLITDLKLDTSHHTGQNTNKGKILSPRRDIQNYLTNQYPIQSHALKLRLIREGFKIHECEVCKLSKWMNNPIPLELDHIDGCHANNELTNLRLLCPNCHAQTDTYRGKNIKTVKKPILKILKPLQDSLVIKTPKAFCVICKNEILHTGTKYCSQICNHKDQQKIEWSNDLLVTMLALHNGNMTKIGLELGVSDNAVRKQCKNFSIDISQYRK